MSCALCLSLLRGAPPSPHVYPDKALTNLVPQGSMSLTFLPTKLYRGGEWLGSVRYVGWGHSVTLRSAHKSRVQVVRLSTGRLQGDCLPHNQCTNSSSSMRALGQLHSCRAARASDNEGMNKVPCVIPVGRFVWGSARNGYFVPLKRGWRPRRVRTLTSVRSTPS